MSVNAALIAGSVACSLAFYVLTGLILLVRRPPVPPTLTATSDLGPETPAVANLLANGGTVTPEAVPATLLDFAARKFVAIEETEPHRYACRVVQAAPPGLTAYEGRVMRLVTSRATGGVVPAGALTLGSEDQATTWLRSFRRDVNREARSKGLTKPRWPQLLLTFLGLLTFADFGLIAVATNDSNGSTHLSIQWFIALIVAFGTLAVSNRVFRDDSQVMTAPGLQAAARWLSLRKYLHDDELFSSLPPTAVAVRDRYIAYGAALGVAAGAVRAIPMGAESDGRAWSNVGGRWRQVTVTYPTLWPPAYGMAPQEALWAGVRFAGVGALILWGAAQVLPRVPLSSLDRLTRDLGAAVVLAGAIGVVLVAIGLWLMLAGVVSVFGASTVTGDAVRIRQFPSGIAYLAVDTGRSDRLRAWKVRPAVFGALLEYSTVTVSVTPLLGFVRSVQRAPAGAAAAAAPASV